MEQRISELIESTINDLGYELVKVTIHGSRTKVVEILIERQDSEKIQVGECQLVSKNISAILDVEDIISGKYFLEVSSAGVERPLVKRKDFERFSGRDVKIRLKVPFNGNLTYKGKLLGIEDDKVKLKSKNVELTFDRDNIKKANLVLTEELFRALLNKKK
jgi:ribosome maturation factor RimP